MLPGFADRTRGAASLLVPTPSWPLCTLWPQGNGYALGPAGSHLRRQSVLEERDALVLPHFSTRLPRLLKHLGEKPPFLDAKGDLGLCARFFRPRRF